MCIFFAKFIYDEYIRHYFLFHVVSTIFARDLPMSLTCHIIVVIIACKW